ncbi:MAG: ATP-binding cassette domain-containing protein [Gaiella sp.]
MTAPVVLAEGLSKDYGADRGVADLSFAVEEGEVFGYLGPNGAGKTTTIRLMLDLIRPTAGRIALFGLDARRDGSAARARIGYLPGDLRLYDRLTAREHLRYLSELRGMRDLGDGLLLAQRLELELDRPVRALSRGNRQKVGLVLALMHRPHLIVFDEPTAGLDPLVQQVVYALVREATADGRTVFVSSHVLSEVQHLADRVALVRDGRLQLIETVDVLRQRARSHVEATFVEPPALDAFAGIPGVHELERHGATVRLSLEGSVDPLIKELAQHEVQALDIHEADLEDVFLDLYRRSDDAR